MTDGTTTKTVPVTTSFQQGVWIHFPVSVPAGGFVRVTANKTAANNAVIAGLFLGGAGAPPTPNAHADAHHANADPGRPPAHATPPYESGVKGSWVGTYGADGYALGGWTGPGTGDLTLLPNATLTVEQGFRYSWASPTTDVRALQSPDATERRATGWYHASSSGCGSTSAPPTRARSTSTASTGRTRAGGCVTVTDGTTTKTVPVTTSFQQGVWIHFPVSVPAGGFVRVTANKTAANNAVIAGLFLGGRGSRQRRRQRRRQPHPDAHADAARRRQPPPRRQPDADADPQPHAHAAVRVGRQGDWVGTYGADGYALGGWTGPGTGDLALLPNATLTMEQGFRYSWASPTTDVRRS